MLPLEERQAIMYSWWRGLYCMHAMQWLRDWEEMHEDLIGRVPNAVNGSVAVLETSIDYVCRMHEATIDGLFGVMHKNKWVN